MDVMLWIFVDLLKSGSSLLVDPHVVLVKCFLPVFGLLVIESAGSLVGR